MGWKGALTCVFLINMKCVSYDKAVNNNNN